MSLQKYNPFGFSRSLINRDYDNNNIDNFFINPFYIDNYINNSFINDLIKSIQNSFLGKVDQKFENFLNPKTDIASKDDEYVVTIEIPGVSPDEVKLEINDNVLILKGEKKNEYSENEKDKQHVAERVYGSFERSFTLPEDIVAENISAIQKDGILTIKIPRQEKKKQEVRNIAIKAA